MRAFRIAQAVFGNQGEHARAAPTAPKYAGFCSGISTCLPFGVDRRGEH